MTMHYALEACAYNEMNTMFPDERGFQPRNRRVREEDVLGMVRETALPVDELVQKMIESGWKEEFVRKVGIFFPFQRTSSISIRTTTPEYDD